MKIYFGHSQAFDYKQELYKPIRGSVLNTQHEIIFPHEDGEQTGNAKDTIKSCDLVLADVSFPSTGLGIELGWADAFNIPIVCFGRKGTKKSESLKFITTNLIEYSDASDLIERICKFLLTFGSSTSEVIKRR